MNLVQSYRQMIVTYHKIVRIRVVRDFGNVDDAGHQLILICPP